MPNLQIPTAQASELIDGQIDAGGRIGESAAVVETRERFDAWRREQKQWMDVTKDALRHIYGGEEEARSFGGAATHRAFVAGGEWPEWLEDYTNDVENGISRLRALKSALRFATAPPAPSASSTTATPTPEGGGVIFLVHGRDVGVRERVARFLEKAGNHRVVILDEQANRGRTLIEKFEKHAGEAKYAVVLLTGDDVGGAKGDAQQPRARQNVVFELGFFFGQLGRDHVAVLYEHDVENPSDVAGIAYISLSTSWEQQLVRELRDAGLDFSLDRV